MSNKKKEVILKHRPSTSGYHLANLKAKQVRRKRLGSSINAVNELLAYPFFAKSVVARIIRNSSTDVQFDKRVEDYFDALSIVVPFEGKALNVTMKYKNSTDEAKFEDKELEIRKAYHNKIIATTDLVKQKELFNERTDKLIELEETKLENGASPLNNEHYLIWRYSLINAEVANREADTSSSNRIRFYLSDRADNALMKKDREDKVVVAHKMFTDIMGENSKVNNLYEVLFPKGKDKKIPTRQVELMEYILRNPNSFIDKIKDKDLSIKATIERLITKGVLKRYPSSNLIIDSMTNEKIGKSVDDAISWFKNPDNKDAIDKLSNRYKNA